MPNTNRSDEKLSCVKISGRYSQIVRQHYFPMSIKRCFADIFPCSFWPRRKSPNSTNTFSISYSRIMQGAQLFDTPTPMQFYLNLDQEDIICFHMPALFLVRH